MIEGCLIGFGHKKSSCLSILRNSYFFIIKIKTRQQAKKELLFRAAALTLKGQ
jgi:hypothetical protein